MPNQEHERERERDQTHSYWYIPSALRVNYSLLVMESAGMMKMLGNVAEIQNFLRITKINLWRSLATREGECIYIPL